jgi:hypothetical protein
LTRGRSLAWRSGGLATPEKVARASEDLFDEQGRLGSFIRECVQPCAGARISGERFYAVYSQWWQRAGVAKLAMLGRTDFGERMARKYTRKKCHGVRVYYDIEIPEPLMVALLNPGVPDLDDGIAWRPDGQGAVVADADGGPVFGGDRRTVGPGGGDPLADGGGPDWQERLAALREMALGQSGAEASPGPGAGTDPRRRPGGNGVGPQSRS